MIPLYSALLLFASPASAQTIGGEYETLFQLDGALANEWLGHSVSAAGDVNGDGFDDVIIGATYGAAGGTSRPGAAHVVSGADNSILYQFYGTSAQDWFGFSVAGAGDINGDGFDDLIVGSPRTDPTGFSRNGSVHVYSGADGSELYRWDGMVAYGEFGTSVAGIGDLNGDGFDDVAAGGYQVLPGGPTKAGQVLAFSGADGSLLHRWDGAAAYDYAFNVAAAGDVNGDGYPDVIVGASSAGPIDAGLATVYSGFDGSLLYQWSGENPSDWFGFSISGAGDINSDGFADLLVGAPSMSTGGLPDTGAAYVYSGVDGTLMVRLDGMSYFASFGSAVACAGDVNGDGVTDLLIGSEEADVGSMLLAGAAYLFSSDDFSILQQWQGESSIDSFGYSVSSAGDFNGDGLADVIVGAPFADPGSRAFAGSAYVYAYNPYLYTNTRTVSATSGGVIDLSIDFPTAAAFEEYKSLVSISGTGPTNFGVDIPLTLDSLVANTFFGYYPVPTSNAHGTLDVTGNAIASFTMPTGMPSGLIGNTFNIAVVANQPGQRPNLSSAAVAITIVP